jgi:predicted regulator of Ras-like GTPase activity (Roadblock/LC7/MglB family)
VANTMSQAPNSFWSGQRLATLLKRSNALLKEIEQVPHIQQAILFDQRGALLAARVNDALTRESVDRIGASVSTIIAAFPERAFTGIEIGYEGGLLFVRKLGHAFIAVVTADDSNLAMLRMTLNVAAEPFESDKDLQNNLALL